MVGKRKLAGALLALGGAAVCSAAEPADHDPLLTGCRDALLAQFAKLESAMPEMTRSADAAAERILGGGRLFAGGRPGFVAEPSTRAGGLMMVLNLDDKTALSKQDVLLVGALTNSDGDAVRDCRRGKAAGAYVVLISAAYEQPEPPIAALCDAHVVNFAPTSQADAAGAAAAFAEEQRAAAASSLFNVPALWTWTGELIGSFTRKGKTPVVWESVVLPDGRARNAKYLVKDDPSKQRFHEDLSVPPQPEGRLGRLYLDALRRQVSGLRGPVLEQMAAAAALMADCVRKGGTVQVQAIAHYTAYEEVELPGLPAWMKCAVQFRPADSLAAEMKPGDVYFEVGYMELRPEYLEVVAKQGGRSVVALCHAPVCPLDGPQPTILMDSQWDYGDAAVLLPGDDVKILPASGVLQTVIFRSVIAKAAALLAK
jgi:hypothetical protein